MKTVPGITDLAVFEYGRSADRRHRDRPRTRRPLRPCAGRHQLDDPGRDRRAGRRQCLRVRQRPQFPDRRPLAPQYRQSLDAIRHITIGAPNPSGSGVVPIPLTDVAKVSLVSGPSFIYRENQERYVPIKFSVRDRDLGGAVLEAQRKVAEQVALPPGSPSRMGRRVRRTAGGDRPARGRGAAQPRAHLHAAVFEFRFDD